MKDFHSSSIKRIFKELKTQENGLNLEEAEKRLKKGKNDLPREKPIGKLNILLSQFNNPLAIILLLAGAISLVLKEYIDSAVIFSAVLINSFIGYFQENKANEAILKLKDLVEHKALVLRGGQEYSINSQKLVVGDIILINSGNRIPADARLFEAYDLMIEESALTGESMPSKKSKDLVPQGAALADRENMVYAGTMAMSGVGKGVVTAIGSETEIGKIAKLVKNTKEEKTPLQKRLNSFSKMLGILFGVICLMIVAAGLWQGRSFIKMMETGVALGVASIPEGLTISVTFILALGMQRILKKKALTRKLLAAEALGSTTVICTDKTGTLTEGKMHVAHIIIGEKEFEPQYLGTRQNEKEAKSASLALQTGMMCNDAFVENPDDELAAWKIIGSPTEAALLSAAIQSGLRKEKILEKEREIDELPFDSGRKYMLSLYQRGKNCYVLYEKGAPEKILLKSAKFHHLGQVQNIREKERKILNSVYEGLTARGLRVIGLAVKEFKPEHSGAILKKGQINWEEIDNDLVFVGFIAIKDPLRKTSKETIRLAKEAGIRPVIITGDHQLTAKAIAEEVGLNSRPKNIVTGEELERISDEKLLGLVKKIDIYARVSPHHKLRIVKKLQECGEVVAMTGDGINDSPALKAADIGISLGTGTDIAKETSDIILLDDNFKTIVAAIKQGRIIFKNIRKVITFLLSDVFSEIIIILGSILFKAPLAILPAQILWINIINDGLPHFSLAYEKSGRRAMKEKPLKKNEPLLNKEMKMIIFAAGIARDLIIFAIFYYLWLKDADLEYLRTLMFVTVGLKSLFSIFSIRKFHTSIWRYNPFSNSKMVYAVGVSLGLLVAGVYFPPLSRVLSTTSEFGAGGWALAVSVGLLSVLFIEIAKFKYIKEYNAKHEAQ